MAEGFTVISRQKELSLIPLEDSYNIGKEGTVSVADGVTRDPLEYLPNTNRLWGKFKFAWNYPRPSPATTVARIFTRTFTSVVEDYNKANRDKRAISAAFEEANNKISLWNKQNIKNPDYVLKDLAGCVASGISQGKDVVYLGFIADCGVAIFDHRGALKFRTQDEGPGKHDEYFWQDKRLQGLTWNHPEARKIIRTSYRNSPDLGHSFGVLTGEKSAMSYVETTSFPVRPADNVIVYTNGLEEAIFSGEFSTLLRRNCKTIELERLCRKKVKKEGTLVRHEVTF